MPTSEATSSDQLSLIYPQLQSMLALKKKKKQTSGFLGDTRIILILHYCSFLIPRTELCRIEVVLAVSQSCVEFGGTGLLVTFDIYPM